MSPNCLERNTSTVAIQALHLMNNAMVEEQAERFAARVSKEAGDEPEKQIERAYWIALGRPPSREEAAAGLEGMRRFTSLEKAQSAGNGKRKVLESLCHVLVNSAAFLYID
jgi:hypothetical protein